MLQYFTNKVKKHPEEKAAADKPEKDESKQNESKQDEPKQKPTAEISKEEGLAGAESKASPTVTPIPQIISQPPKEDDDDDDVASEGTPVLDHEDEKFLERLTSSHSSLGAADDDEDETPPALPPRVKTPVLDIESDTSSVLSREIGKDAEPEGKGKEKEGEHDEKEGKEKEKKPSDRFKRFSFATNFPRHISFRRKSAPTTQSQSESASASTSALKPDTLTVPSPPEAVHETSDLARILDDLNLSARNNRAISLSSESAAMARRFTQVLKDLTNGVPTAYDDLIALLEDRDGLLARNFEKLPSGLKRLVAQLPEKLTTSLAPELLAAAAEAQGLHTAGKEAGKSAAFKTAAKTYLSPSSLHDLVTKPGAIAGLLRGIVNALKTRFPAFVGTNVLWSLAVFLLLSMLWYCYKRGREVRLEREAAGEEGEEGEGEKRNADGEKADAEKGDGGGGGGGIEGPRVEELPDDPMLAAPPVSEPVRHDGEAVSKS
ncbi:hypothetical protein F5B17DRAFT_189773 [Nemania serpens]|nr:hypothetical protein F5B17DRAFT_189773 [Nemania serpens]